jgi:hypothetical protein
VSILTDLFKIGNGIRSGIQDAPGLVKDVLTLNGHGVLTDGRKLIGDVNDVLGGAAHLGLDLGKLPEKYAGSLGKWADSPVLSAAQLGIEGEKKLTGSGDPQVGTGYKQSAVKLNEAVETLIDAEVNPDIWDGAASRAYDETSKAHRRHVSDVSVADGDIGDVLNTEAGQVTRTRKTLDDTSQYLYDYGLATAWMNYVPGLDAAKLAADTVAATGALTTTNTTMMILAKNALENALKIRQSTGAYDGAAKDTSGAGGICGTFVDPHLDQRNNLPTRLHPDTKYTYPKSTHPPSPGPPATPYASPAPAPHQ